MATALEYDALKTGNASSAQETWEDIADAGTYEQVGASEHASAADAGTYVQVGASEHASAAAASKAPLVPHKQPNTDTKRQQKIKTLEMKRNDLQKVYDSFKDNRTFTEDQMELCAQLRKVNSLLDDLHYKESSLSGQEIKRRKKNARDALQSALDGVLNFYKRELCREVAKCALDGINPSGTVAFAINMNNVGHFSSRVATGRDFNFEDNAELICILTDAVKSGSPCKPPRPSLHLLLQNFKIDGRRVDPHDARLQAVVDLVFTAYEHTPATQ